MRPEGFPLFYDGAIGYLGYNLKNSIVPRLKTNAHDDAHFWDMYMAFPRVIIGFDNEKKIFLTAEESSNREIARFESILRVEDLTIQKEVSKRKNLKRIDTNVSLEQYGKIFERAKEYILSGDTYQIKISIRHEFELKEDPFLTYLRLRKTNPAPYAAYLDLEDVVLVSCSPEELIRLEGRVAQTRPIGGTYPRGKNPEEDDEIALNFYRDEKEVAEHSMLIDLERNDLGRVCVPGSVRIAEKMALEKYANLMHIVTTIQGNLDQDKTSFDLLRSMFPGGTVTGCPKIRTMEIIDELEPVSRGPYTGSIGFITPSDEMQFNIIIRTLAINKKSNRGYIQVGGGIVVDSNAEYEYQENLRKGKAIVDTILS